MSNDDFEGIKYQIHSRINKIEEAKDEEEDPDQLSPSKRAVEDDEG